MKDLMKKSIFAFFSLLFLASCGGGSNNNSSETINGIEYSGDIYIAQQEGSISEHVSLGVESNSDQILNREGFTIGFNYENLVADWVAYSITKESVSKSYSRSNYYTPDTEVPYEYRLDGGAFGSFVRGHLAPAATVDFSESSMLESFKMTNIAPQTQELNSGKWATLEQWVRDCATEVNHLIVFTGPIYLPNNLYFLVDNEGRLIKVPDYYYKIIIKPESPAQAIAFILPNNSGSFTKIADYKTNIDDIESRTNIDFLSNVKDDIETKLEFAEHEICHMPLSGEDEDEDEDEGWSCSYSPYCYQLSSCSEAYYYLNTCGLNRLDGDNDGIPCETLCN